MMHRVKLHPLFSLLLACLAAGLQPSCAGDAALSTLMVDESAAKQPISYETAFGSSWIGESKLKHRDRSVGALSEISTSARVVLSLPIRDDFLLRLGVDWQRTSFDRPARSLVPDTLQSLTAVIGADFNVGQSWLVRFEAQPGFYNNGRDYDWRHFSIPFVLGGSYIVSADLQWILGVSYFPDRKYPVLPGVGVRWHFAERWTLNTILPTPRLEYSATKSVTLYVGAELGGGTYRVSSGHGTAVGNARLNDAIVDLSEIRAGAGALWKVRADTTLCFEAGCVPFRDFNFTRAETEIETTRVAPYVNLALASKF